MYVSSTVATFRAPLFLLCSMRKEARVGTYCHKRAGSFELAERQLGLFSYRALGANVHSDCAYDLAS